VVVVVLWKAVRHSSNESVMVERHHGLECDSLSRCSERIGNPDEVEDPVIPKVPTMVISQVF
jgi:hypothetical protein